jgi:hypothetical protein
LSVNGRGEQAAPSGLALFRGGFLQHRLAWCGSERSCSWFPQGRASVYQRSGCTPVGCVNQAPTRRAGPEAAPHRAVPQHLRLPACRQGASEPLASRSVDNKLAIAPRIGGVIYRTIAWVVRSRQADTSTTIVNDATKRAPVTCTDWVVVVDDHDVCSGRRGLFTGWRRTALVRSTSRRGSRVVERSKLWPSVGTEARPASVLHCTGTAQRKQRLSQASPGTLRATPRLTARGSAHHAAGLTAPVRE